jgi:hypothetical protein
MTWRTFFDAVIMAAAKRRLLLLPKVTPVLPQSSCDGTSGSRGSRCACASRSRNGTRARCLHAVGEGSLAVLGGDVSLADDVTAASAHLPPPLLPAHFWPYSPSCSRGGTVVARVAVQFLARSNRRAGYMTCGPGPPCRTRRSRKGAPPWCGCMPPAWRSALSPVGLGESGGMLVTAGQLRAPRAAVWLLLPWASLHDTWDPAPVS